MGEKISYEMSLEFLPGETEQARNARAAQIMQRLQEFMHRRFADPQLRCVVLLPMDVEAR